MASLRSAGLLASVFLAFSGLALAQGQGTAKPQPPTAPAQPTLQQETKLDGTGNPAAVSQDGGKWVDKDGNPTFKIGPDGKVDWYTYIGFLRYSANCLQCHGPDGLGSTYAPSLVDAFHSLSYTDFYATVAGGKKNVSAAQDLVMPALGTNKNVMCYIDEIYVYLRARSDGALGRGRPASHVPKPAGFSKAEDSCMG